MKKYLFFFCLVFSIMLLSCQNTKSSDETTDQKKGKSNTVITDGKDSQSGNTSGNKEKIIKKEITVIGVGDVMLGSNYPVSSLLPKGNILKNTEKILKDADITVGNLEGTLFDKGGTPKSCGNPSVCYVFRTPSEYGVYFKEAGFDYLSIANNHSNDFGEEGISQTMKNLDELGIKYSGIKKISEYAILEKEGIKYGFVSFAPNMMTVNLNDYTYATNLIKSVKTQADIVIVMFHGGAEGSKHEHIPRRNEIYYGENRGNVFQFARMAVDSGADIVFGQGPHVTRAVELYKDKFISYSAGNFATFGNFNLNGPNGIAPIFKITIDNMGNFLFGEIISTRQYKGGIGPSIDPGNGAVKKIISLSKSDFPEGNNLNITYDGKMTKVK